MVDDAQAVQQVISHYNQAITNRDLENAVKCFGEGYFAISLGKGSTHKPSRWRAGSFRTHVEMHTFLSNAFSVANGAYTNTIEFLHTDVE